MSDQVWKCLRCGFLNVFTNIRCARCGRDKQMKVGDIVLKYSGDYQLEGEVRSVFTTKSGKIRYVVEHDPGFLHIYSKSNIKLSDTFDV